MNAIILSIGDELTLGQTVDTNSAWISKELAARGCDVLGHVTVPDQQVAIAGAIASAVGNCDCLIVSGGLGPTADDLTRQALADVLNEPLEINHEWLTEMQRFFRQRGRPMPEANQIQAMIPRGATMLWNTCGTAAGIAAIGKGHSIRKPDAAAPLSFGAASRGHAGTVIFVVPGVPKEMKAMLTRDVFPDVEKRAGGAAILSRTLHTFGLGESSVAEMLGSLMNRDRNPSVGTTVSGGIVSLRLNSRFGSPALALEKLNETDAACRSKLGDLIFGADDQTLAAVVAELLTKSGGAIPTVTTAESCTGGLLAKMLTDIPGSSRYFREGFVTYANESKQRLLGVPAEMIEKFGAVSEPVAQAMAAGARRAANAVYALGITGIAGPDGGSEAKPVGMVCIALASEEGEAVRTFNFPGDREWIRDRSAKMALTMLRYKLLAKPLPF
jgi:nicotinamide-nucleotide amidase